MDSKLNDAVILITGGTGSFGTAMTKELLANYNPKAIRIYSRGEYLQYMMKKEFHDERLRFFIGDVRDKDRLYRALEGVNICIHAAAIKQIPTCEFNVYEAINTNVVGTKNVTEAALDNGVFRSILISSDKACQPVNTYGATKFTAERVYIQSNAYVGKKRTRFACTRYGNVVGSRGSVIPLFLEQKELGELTITDERMTRFWLTLEQGVKFVINCLDEMKGGEIFVPKIPSMKVVDVADAMAPEAPRRIIGIRVGEKLHEVLLTEEESTHAIEFFDHYVILPEMVFWEDVKYEGKPAKIGEYSSDKNIWWLTKEELKGMIDGL